MKYNTETMHFANPATDPDLHRAVETAESWLELQEAVRKPTLT